MSVICKEFLLARLLQIVLPNVVAVRLIITVIVDVNRVMVDVVVLALVVVLACGFCCLNASMASMH